MVDCNLMAIQTADANKKFCFETKTKKNPATVAGDLAETGSRFYNKSEIILLTYYLVFCCLYSLFIKFYRNE